MGSVWKNTAQLPRFAPLKNDAKTDVLIIGGGLTGILCAYMLEQAGVNYILTEASTLCAGITQNTTAKITAQHGLIYDRLIRDFGVDRARLYLQANQNALEQYRTMCQSIDCDFEQQDSFVYSRNDRKKLEREVWALDKLGAAAQVVSTPELPFATAGAVQFARQGQFHPLKFVRAIAEGRNIFEHTKIWELAPGRARTSSGDIRAQKIIVATHFPILNKHGSYFLKMYQHRSYVLALKNAPAMKGMYVDEAETGMSFRRWGDLLLLGGGSHRTGKQGGGWRELEEFARRYYPKAQIVSRWATQDCMTLDGVPYIGQYSKHTPDLYVATGFNKWGMTGAMAAADLLTDLVLERDSPYVSLFFPSRTILRPQLAVNALEAAINLLTPTVPRCPHMGCALKYNPAEHSWDCPCHGSRFGEDGRLIDNPATDDKQL